MSERLTQNTLKRAIFIGLVVNAFLMVLKLSVGWIGEANALVGDGLNSTTDLVISIMILLGLKISKKRPDKDHHYGHEKFEGVIYFTLGILFLGSALVLIGASLQSIIQTLFFEGTRTTPSRLTLIVTVIALFIKIGLYAGMRVLSSKTEHRMIKADATNHLIDIFATLITLFGIYLARINAVIYDDIAALVISGFIIHLAFVIIRESLGYLTDEAPAQKYVSDVRLFIQNVKGVKAVDDLKIRKHMTHWYIDVEIAVEQDLSLMQAHTIAETVHHAVEDMYEDVIHCMVHVNPDT